MKYTTLLLLSAHIRHTGTACSSLHFFHQNCPHITTCRFWLRKCADYNSNVQDPVYTSDRKLAFPVTCRKSKLREKTARWHCFKSTSHTSKHWDFSLSLTRSSISVMSVEHVKCLVSLVSKDTLTPNVTVGHPIVSGDTTCGMEMGIKKWRLVSSFATESYLELFLGWFWVWT